MSDDVQPPQSGQQLVSRPLPPPPRNVGGPPPQRQRTSAPYPIAVTRPVERNSLVMLRGNFTADLIVTLVEQITAMAGHDQWLLIVTDDAGNVTVQLDARTAAAPPPVPVAAVDCPSTAAMGRPDRCGLFASPPTCRTQDGHVSCWRS